MNRYINRYFMLPVLICILIGCFLLFTVPKGRVELQINLHYNTFFDWFFYIITEMGNGWFLTITTILLFAFVKFSHGLFLGLQGLLVSFCSNMLKHVFFPDEPRPPAFFDKSIVLHFVKGSEVFYTHSFPSGHTMTVFCMFCTLSFFVKRKGWGLLFAALAILVAVSRMYLLKHFLLDVTVAATLGIVISIGTLMFVYPMLERANVLNRNLIRPENS